MSSTDPDKKYHAPALAKGLEILELLCRESDPMTLAEMTERLGRSRSEIFRMVQELEFHEYIRRPQQGDGYEITEKMFLLSVERPKTKTLLEAALPEMRRFATLTGHSVHVAIPTKQVIVVIARVEGEGPVAFSVRVGHTQAIVEATSGIVLFAHQPPDVQKDWLTSFRNAEVEFDKAAFLAEAKRAEDHGAYSRASRFVNGVVDVAAPVIRQGRAVATLTAPCLTRIDVGAPQELPIKALQKAAAKITEALRN